MFRFDHQFVFDTYGLIDRPRFHKAELFNQFFDNGLEYDGRNGTSRSVHDGKKYFVDHARKSLRRASRANRSCQIGIQQVVGNSQPIEHCQPVYWHLIQNLSLFTRSYYPVVSCEF